MYTKTIFLTVISLLALVFFYNQGFIQSVDQKTSIHNIMAYSMSEIVKRCQKDHNYSDQDMIILEKELKRFLALELIKDTPNLGTGMYSTDVDNLWHTFLLFTKEYAEFCQKHFNHFIHHVPEIEKVSTSEQIEEVHKDFKAFVKNYEELFGEEIHPIWFVDMGDAIDGNPSSATT